MNATMSVCRSLVWKRVPECDFVPDGRLMQKTEWGSECQALVKGYCDAAQLKQSEQMRRTAHLTTQAKNNERAGQSIRTIDEVMML